MTTPLIKPAPPRTTGALSNKPATHARTAAASHPTEPTTGKLSERTVETPNPVSALRRRMSPSEFNTAMVHFYRGEVQRSNTWRNRLDTTTNWAVITAGATLSFAFTSPSNPHFVIIINSVLVAFFLFMEARRYRYYEIWSSRVRVLETKYFAGLLQPEREMDDSWVETLASDLHTPHFTISEWEAVGRRLRRNYLWIFILLAGSWNLKVYLHPVPARTFDIFLSRAAIGTLPGEFVFAVGIVFNVILIIFALATIRLREATGEVLPRHEFNLESIRRVTNWRREDRDARATYRRAKRARARVRTTSNLNATGEFRKPDTGEFKKPERAPTEPENILR